MKKIIYMLSLVCTLILQTHPMEITPEQKAENSKKIVELFKEDLNDALPKINAILEQGIKPCSTRSAPSLISALFQYNLQHENDMQIARITKKLIGQGYPVNDLTSIKFPQYWWTPYLLSAAIGKQCLKTAHVLIYHGARIDPLENYKNIIDTKMTFSDSTSKKEYWNALISLLPHTKKSEMPTMVTR